MLSNIKYTLPSQTEGDRDFFRYLSAILLELSNATQQKGEIVIASSQPAGALPVTTLTQNAAPFPQLYFEGLEDLKLTLGNFCVNPEVSEYVIDGKGFDKITVKRDSLGTYYALKAGKTTLYRLPINELAKRLKGHITRIDHTGLNLPSALVTPEVWQQVVQKIAKSANLYKYPTGEDWPFILPVTKTEYNADITDFVVGREPRFELVYDMYSPVVTIQIDIETDLSRSEVERLLPEPYGISFPDLADFFRTAYVHHSWLGLAIRFDIRFKNDKLDGDWKTGKWLIKDGGRIASS